MNSIGVDPPPGTLHGVATPSGNLGDQSRRAVETLDFSNALLMGVLFCFGAASASASCRDISLPMSVYFQSIAPGAMRGEIHVPLVLVMEDREKISLEVSGNEPDSPGPDLLMEMVAERYSKPGRASNNHFAALSMAIGNEGRPAVFDDVNFPVVVLVRLESGAKTPSSQPLTVMRDEIWESALRSWSESGDAPRNCVVLSLRPGE